MRILLNNLILLVTVMQMSPVFVFQSLDCQTNSKIIEEVKLTTSCQNQHRCYHHWFPLSGWRRDGSRGSQTLLSHVCDPSDRKSVHLNVNLLWSPSLHFLFHKAEHAHAKRSPGERDADMERVQIEFKRLPPSSKNLISAVFDAVVTRRPQLVEKGEAGVLTQSDMREALRLMGWEENETSAHIVETWYITTTLNLRITRHYCGILQVQWKGLASRVSR